MNRWISPLLLLALLLPALEPVTVHAGPARNRTFNIARENVLGTSLDISLFTDSQEKADRFERAFMKELDRLSRIYSRYDPDSELSKLNRARVGEYISVSKDLYYLIRKCRRLQLKSSGAFNPFCGRLLDLWRTARDSNQLPDPAQLKALASRYEKGELGFLGRRRKSEGKRTYFIQKKYDDVFDLDAMAKGRIIDFSLEAALGAAEVQGALVNIGGDIRCYGDENGHNRGWSIAIADPANPADNARPLTRLRIRNLSVATSAGYARQWKIQGKTHSHIVDPRTGRPVNRVLSATAVAPTAEEADGLATTLCVLEPRQGLALIESWPAAACLIVERSGRVHRSRAWTLLESSPPPAGPASRAWPDGYGVKIRFTLTRKDRGKYHRHFVAAWVSDAAGRTVRMLALWYKAKERSYLEKLDNFWKYAYVFSNAHGDLGHFRSVSRATRPLGSYTLYWDGRDDKGRPVPPGAYTFHIDINRENGPGHEKHAYASATLNCGTRTTHTATPGNTGELADVSVRYGPVKEP